MASSPEIGLSALIERAGEPAARRFLEFSTVKVRTRKQNPPLQYNTNFVFLSGTLVSISRSMTPVLRCTAPATCPAAPSRYSGGACGMRFNAETPDIKVVMLDDAPRAILAAGGPRFIDRIHEVHISGNEAVRDAIDLLYQFGQSPWTHLDGLLL